MPEVKENIKIPSTSKQVENGHEHILSPEEFVTKQAETAPEKATEAAIPIIPVALPSDVGVAPVSTDTIVLKKLRIF